ncbi:hypothetical protein [Vagococcus carniphilus]|uniref:hypothetical protein n=1 Tax=Vagococcus carniphilus TaxID=218144 RepID=UPI00288DC7CF|nr:hypothetical protein [Vagococcus carniphilus]MDT2866154.1 hypothetical protein [Vagococcus carniphilus]
MKKRIMLTLLLSSVFLVFGCVADGKSNKKSYEPPLGKPMNQSEIIKDLSMRENISFREAELKLFPNAEKLEEENQFRIISGTLEKATESNDHLIDLGKIYFYTLTTSSQNFRAIRQVLYASYTSKNQVFSGSLQYCLTDSNKIHYTLNGALYDGDRFTTSGIGKANLYEATFLNFNVPTESSCDQPIFIDKDICY